MTTIPSTKPSQPFNFTSIPYSLTTQENVDVMELEEVHRKPAGRRGAVRHQRSEEVDWSMRTIDERKIEEFLDSSRLQTIDELREVFYFHPFSIPGRVHFEMLTPNPGNEETKAAVVVVVEEHNARYKERLLSAIRIVHEKFYVLVRFVKDLRKQS